MIGSLEGTLVVNAPYAQSRVQEVELPHMSHIHESVLTVVVTHLHNEKVRIVDIELNRAKQILHSGWSCICTINQVLVPSTNHYL